MSAPATPELGLFFLRRLRRLLMAETFILEHKTANEAGERLMRRAVHATELDCRDFGVGIEAAQLIETAKKARG